MTHVREKHARSALAPDAAARAPSRAPPGERSPTPRPDPGQPARAPAEYARRYAEGAVSQTAAAKVEGAFSAGPGQLTASALQRHLREILEKAGADGDLSSLVDLNSHCLERSHELAERLRARGVEAARTQVRGHVFLTVQSPTGELVVDPTYRQFLRSQLSEAERSALPAVFVGTRDELASLYARAGVAEPDRRADSLYGFGAQAHARRHITRERAAAIMQPPG